jgi:hypothetical protein
MPENQNHILASCATILIVMGVFVFILFIIGAGILISNVVASGL